MKIKNRSIDKNSPVFIVAEVSCNHMQRYDLAVRMVEEAKKCGADGVKFQCYTPDTITIDAGNRYFRIKHARWGGQTLYQLYEKAYTPWSWLEKLKKRADSLGLIFFATAFDRTSVDFLEELDVPLHKIASFELVDLPLIEYAAKKKKPMILSTGMASFQEIGEAVRAAKRSGAKDVALLRCVSSYPADPAEMNLETIRDMERRFKCEVGLSDHTLGMGVPIAAVSLGARIIEKHFILSRKMKTPDSFFSIEPRELKELVRNVRVAETAVGGIHYGLTEDEKKNLVFRRSLFVVEDIKKGEAFTADNVRSIRPGAGIKPKYLKGILGKKARINIKRGTPVRLDLVEKAASGR